MVKIGLNIQKSPGDQRELAVTQTPLKDHYCGKLSKNKIIIIIIIIIGH